MTRYNIRLRRQQFTQSRIIRHKNYDSLMQRQRRYHNRKIRGVTVLAFVLILAIAVAIAQFKTKSKQKDVDDKFKTELKGP